MEKNSLINSLKTKEPYFEIKTLLANCTRKQQVQFALLAAKSAEKFYDKSKYPKVYSSSLKVFKLIEKWLENPKSIYEKELEKAARAAAAGAVYAAYAANAAYAVAYAARAAANAANAARAAANAANAARAAANVNENKHLEFLLFELIKLIAIDKGYSIAALEVLYGQIKA